MLLSSPPSLVEQAYEAMLGEIVDGTLMPGSHLVQEVLATRYGVSRQPIQLALLLLKTDGLVIEVGKRGLVVAPLDLQMMHDRYQVRAALDALAARLAARCCASSPKVASATRLQGERIIVAGLDAVQAGAIKPMIAHDIAFHAFIYNASGNPMIELAAEVHWRALRRVMGEVLRNSGPPVGVWIQHRGILEAIVMGEAEAAATHALNHIDSAAGRLTTYYEHARERDTGRKRIDDERNISGAGANEL